ncbi:hypothetical protein EDB83DRAFT_2394682, partial [Lactarius deliciosus]
MWKGNAPFHSCAVFARTRGAPLPSPGSLSHPNFGAPIFLLLFARSSPAPGLRPAPPRSLSVRRFPLRISPCPSCASDLCRKGGCGNGGESPGTARKRKGRTQTQVWWRRNRAGRGLGPRTTWRGYALLFYVPVCAQRGTGPCPDKSLMTTTIINL